MTVSLAVPDVLVARAQAGDEAALEALFRAFETPVYNLVRRMLRRPEDLAVEENHVSWAHMYRMMFVAQIGFALAYLL